MSFFDKQAPRFPMTSTSDYREMAIKRLPKQLVDFLDGGAFDEVTIRKNSEDFQKIQLKRSVLKDVANIDMSTEILGQKFNFPLALGPIGFAGVYAKRGEVQAAKAAAEARVPFSLSTVGICSIEEVAQNSKAPFWFQFYMFKDRHYSLDLLHRAQNARCPVLLLTVDLPIAGARYRYHRTRSSSSFTNFLKELIYLRWWIDVRLCGGPLTVGNLPSEAPPMADLPTMRKWMGSQISQSLTWKDFEWIRANWNGKILIKGILDPKDAQMAQKVGADGIVVSNHGGRHIDGTTSTIEALPKVRDAVVGDLKILIDGGITSGLDIFKALTLGADACMIGKPWDIASIRVEMDRINNEILELLTERTAYVQCAGDLKSRASKIADDRQRVADQEEKIINKSRELELPVEISLPAFRVIMETSIKFQQGYIDQLKAEKNRENDLLPSSNIEMGEPVSQPTSSPTLA